MEIEEKVVLALFVLIVLVALLSIFRYPVMFRLRVLTVGRSYKQFFYGKPKLPKKAGIVEFLRVITFGLCCMLLLFYGATHGVATPLQAQYDEDDEDD